MKTKMVFTFYIFNQSALRTWNVFLWKRYCNSINECSWNAFASKTPFLEATRKEPWKTTKKVLRRPPPLSSFSLKETYWRTFWNQYVSYLGLFKGCIFKASYSKIRAKQKCNELTTYFHEFSVTTKLWIFHETEIAYMYLVRDIKPPNHKSCFP